MSKSMENKTAAIYLCRSTEDEPSAVTHCCSECADALITVKFRRDLAYLPGPPVCQSPVLLLSPMMKEQSALEGSRCR